MHGALWRDRRRRRECVAGPALAIPREGFKQMSNRQLKLGLSLVSNGTHPAGWRLPEARADAALDFALWKGMAQAAEAAKIHFIFLADGIAVRTAASDDDALSYSGRIDQFEPLTLIAGLSAVTERIGYIATASTTYNEPYHV